MESKIFRGLAEAYAEIYSPQEIDEASAQGGRVTGSTQTTFKPTPTSPGTRRGAASTPSSSSSGSVTTQRGRVTGSNPTVYKQAERSAGTRRGAAAGVRGTSTASKPAPTPAAKPAPTPTSRPAATTSTSRPSAAAPTARTSTKTSPTPTTSTSSATAAPKKTFNPLMQKTFGYQTGYAPDQVKKDPKKMAQTGSLKSISSGLDMFDLVKGHLLDEGYADTEEAAIAIMANMSEEWRESIVEAQEARNNPEKYERDQKKKSAAARGEKTPMPPRGDKRREDFEKWYAKQMGR